MSKPAISLVPERHSQIKAIGAALGGLSITETVAHMINSEISKGTIAAGIDGVRIASDENGILIGFDEEPAVRFTKDGVTDLAKRLREFAIVGKSAERLINMQHDYMIARKGSGIMLTIPSTGHITKSFTRDLAHDIADLLTAE